MPLDLGCAKLTAGSEERLDDGGTFGGEDARSDFYLMVEARVGEDFEAGADGATFGIVGAVDEPRDTGLEDCARAHPVARTGKNLPVVDKHGSDGNFAGYGRGTSFGQGFLHVLDVSFHAGRENNTRKERKRN